MDLYRILFVGTFTITAFAMSLLTAKIYSMGVGVSSQTNKVIMSIAIVAPIILIIFMMIGRNGVTKIPFLYEISAIVSTLTGFAFYMFISATLLGFTIILLNFFGVNDLVLMKNISYGFFSLGVLMTIGGLLQAKFIKVTNYEVTLSGAPSSWNGKTAVLVSDTHIGLVNHKKFSDKVVNKILEIHPDFVLHAGDFYDGPYNNTSLITESWKRLTAQIPVFYAPGNHEEYGPYNEFVNSVKNAGVNTLEDGFTTYDGVQIAGITYRGKADAPLVGKVLELMKLRTDMPTILINHPPTFQKEAQSVGVDLMVSGHTHKGQFWPNNFIVMAIYGKYYYGLQNFEDMSAITTSGVGTAGPAMRLFNTPELVLITFRTK
jgi:predicted MPP superfamily phosphohydrolase